MQSLNHRPLPDNTIDFTTEQVEKIRFISKHLGGLHLKDTLGASIEMVYRVLTAISTGSTQVVIDARAPLSPKGNPTNAIANQAVALRGHRAPKVQDTDLQQVQPRQVEPRIVTAGSLDDLFGRQ